jgi:D-alanyl-D-alanine carboxypeptidase/D-alanyl-D-alanine-endopeptidase (penicillin-binding protein 4)
MPSSRRRTLLLAACVVVASCGARGPRAAVPQPAAADATAVLARDLGATLDEPDARAATWGVLVEALDRPGQPLFSHNAESLFVPASNMKLLTVAVAADRLGWDHTFATTIRGTTPLEANGRLRGDLVVSGTGDPTIGDRPTSVGHLAEWADALWQAGLRRVNGRVIGDDRAFAPERLGAGWAWDDVPYEYSAPESPLIYNENAAAIEIVPGPSAGAYASVRLTDAAADLAIDGRVLTGDPGSRTSIGLTRLPGSNRVRVAGTVPAGVAPVVQLVSVDSPARYFAAALRQALVARGIVVRGRAADVESAPPGPLDDAVLLRRQSPPLSVIATRLLKVSQNLYAETLLREAAAPGPSAPTAEAGAAVVKETLLSWGVPETAFAQSDGSGLSRYNLVSPTAFVRVLEHMQGDAKLRDAWMAALPILGQDGTLEGRLRGTPAEGRVHAKTGSMSGVRALSGYVQTRDGRWLVFSIIANNFAVPSSQINGVTDRILQRLVAFTPEARP